jgi:hypothetical protein
MIVERKNPLRRYQALNDTTSGQMGEEPRPEPSKPLQICHVKASNDVNEQCLKTARKISTDLV